jgi:hypothetical protein
MLVSARSQKGQVHNLLLNSVWYSFASVWYWVFRAVYPGVLLKYFSRGSLAAGVEPGGNVPFGLLPPRPPLPPLVGVPRVARPLVGGPVVPRVGAMLLPLVGGPVVPRVGAMLPPLVGGLVVPRVGAMLPPRALPPRAPPPRAALGGMVLSPGNSSTRSGNEVRAHGQAGKASSFRRRQTSCSFVSVLGTTSIHSPLSYPKRRC